jgi:hypothetical protein
MKYLMMANKRPKHVVEIQIICSHVAGCVVFDYIKHNHENRGSEELDERKYLTGREGKERINTKRESL